MTDAIAARDKDHPHWNAAGQGVSVVAGTAGHDKVRQMKAVRGILKNFLKSLVTVGAGLFLPRFKGKGDIRDCFGVGLDVCNEGICQGPIQVAHFERCFHTVWYNIG